MNYRRRIRGLCCLVLLAVCAAPASAHEIPADVVVHSYVKPGDGQLDVLVRVPLDAMRDVMFPLRADGFIDLPQLGDALHDAATIWIAQEFDVHENGEQVPVPEIAAVRLSQPYNQSFRSFDAALAHIHGEPLPPHTLVHPRQAWLDVHLRYDTDSAASEYAIEPRFRRLGLNTTTVVHFLPPGGGERLFEFSDDPGIVHLDPRWHHAFGRFIAFGFDHILDGIDHLLFVLCLIIPFRRIRPLVVIVTAFTVGHSLTLIGSAFGITPTALWFPSLIESLIAASIVYMALENIVGSRWERRWLVAFGFGLVHGFGFSFALQETLQFAGSHLLTSLLAFNLGVELGQLMIIVIVVPLLNLLFRAGLPERIGTIILSAILAHSGWHWMSERFTEFLAWDIEGPSLDAAFFATLMRWLMLALIAGVAVWAMSQLYRRLLSRGKPSAP